MFEIEAEKRTKNCQEAYNSGFNDGYAVGLKAGKDMNVDKWHDLREDPNDLRRDVKPFLEKKLCLRKKQKSINFYTLIMKWLKERMVLNMQKALKM